MKKGFFLKTIVVFLFLLFTKSAFSNTAELMAINFQQVREVSKIELLFDSDRVEGNKFHVQEDKQIIIDLPDVRATERVMRGFDTSEFSGAIVFVKAYKKDGGIRLAIQLRDNVRSMLKREPNRLIVEIENRFGVFTETQMQRTQTFEDRVALADDEDRGRVHVPESDSVEDILENITRSGRKRYVGRRISLNVRNVTVEDILRMIAEASGFNIILTQEIKALPPLTLNVNNIPWDQALDTVLGLNQLVARKNGAILMITTLEKATEDQRLEAAAREMAESEEPLVTRVFPLSFATTTDMSSILTEYLTDGRGRISEDQRTNSLIVRDVPDTIEKMRRIVEVLDTQTPQVLIEAKIVEVTEEYSKEIGLQSGVNFGYDPIGSVTTGSAEVGGPFVEGVDFGPGFSFSSAPVGENSSFFGLTVQRFGRLTDLSFNLQLLETESKGKIIASPKVVTENKKQATITTTDTRFFRVSEQTEQTTNVEIIEVEAELTLEVTPQVTNEGSISLEISLIKEQFSAQTNPFLPPPQQGRSVDTSVLVDNGSTIVIGGVYQYETRESVSGVPFLKDVPLIGWLFRTPYNPSVNKTEMIVFLTPRIVNQEEASMLSQR